MIAGILPCQVTALRSLLIGFLVFFIINTAMGQEKKFLPTQIAIFYNYPPDSLFVNDQPIDSIYKKMYIPVKPGRHTVRAVLAGCASIEKTVEVRIHRTKVITLKFKLTRDAELYPGILTRLSLPTSRFFGLPSGFAGPWQTKIFPTLNVVGLGLGIGAVDSELRKTALAPAIISALGTITAATLAVQRYDKVTGKYSPPPVHTGRLSTHLSTAWIGSRKNILRSTDNRTIQLQNRRRGREDQVLVKLGMGFNAGLRTKLISGLSLNTGLQIHPWTKYELLSSDSLLLGLTADPDDRFNRIEQTESQLFYMFTANLDIQIIRVLDQTIFASFGGAYSNSIEFSESYELPRFPGIIDSDTARVNYKMHIRGFNAGIGSVSPLTSRISIISQFNFHFGKLFSLNAKEEEDGLLLQFFSGLNYQF